MSKPSWLSAYPNTGTLDYFGFRFGRDPLRNYLLRGAASNNFKVAKTLLYYSAIAYAFRKFHSLALDVELSEEQYHLWQDWYKIANYLYIINRHSRHNDTPDSGFLGSATEFKNYFQSFYDSSAAQFNIKETFSRIYPINRPWGYLAQYWGKPLKYFRCVLNIRSCSVGEYAKNAYDLLSQDSSWNMFITCLETGRIDRTSFDEIQSILECKEISQPESKLIQVIIFDKNNINTNENDKYKINYNLIHSLYTTGLDNFKPSNKNDFTMLFSYMALKNLSYGKNDYPWKSLTSSILFEIGINRLFTLIACWSTNGSIYKSNILENIESSALNWLETNNLSGNLLQIEKLWSERHLASIDTYHELFNKMLDTKRTDSVFDGFLQGYIISKISPDINTIDPEAYDALTDPYHCFPPDIFFKNKTIDATSGFIDFIKKVSMWLIDEQFEFSLDRMHMGQKAKFILSKSEFDDQYIFQVDALEFTESRIIIELIDSCLNFWSTAGVLEAA